MTRYAVIESDVIVNVIVWDGEEPYQSDAELLELPPESALGIGWTRNGDEWDAPPRPEPVDIAT